MLSLTMLALDVNSPGQTFGVTIFNDPMRLSLGLSCGKLSAAYMTGTLLGALPITYGYSRIRGVLMTINVASSSLGPLFAGLTFDFTGSFASALIGFAILPIPVVCFRYSRCLLNGFVTTHPLPA